jgi:tetratricopeptide (TPR) repeat protein
LAIGSVIALAVVGPGWYLWAWCTAAAPPVVSSVGVDAAVADAIEAARREVWWQPHSAAAWGRLGQVLFAHGYESESHRCFAQAQQLDPNNPRWPYLLGLGQQIEDPEAALHHLRRAVQLCGNMPDAPELCLAEACLQQNHLQEAEHHFRHVLFLDPDNPRAHLGLGRLAYVRGKMMESRAQLDRSTASCRTQKASHALLAQVYQQLGDSAAAGRERAWAADLPEDLSWPDTFVEEVQALMVGKHCRLTRLESLHERGRDTEARPIGAKLEQDYPDIYWLVEGRQQMAKGQWAAAEQALRTAIQLAPDSVDAHFNLGTVLLEQKNYQAAADAFQRVTQIEPIYGLAYQRLADCWRIQGQRAEAIRALQTATRYMPQNAEIYRELGGLLVQEGRLDEGLVRLQQAIRLQPEDRKTKELLDQARKRAEAR